MYDIAVIGAGPAGSQVAFRLAEKGHSVVVVERKRRLDEPVCCTGIISQECIRSFEIGKDVIHRQANSARIFSPSGKVISVRRQEPQASIVDRPALNLASGSRAENQGAEYLLDTMVRAIEVRNDGVSLEVECFGKKSDSIEAKVAVIAAGFGSKLVEETGFGRVEDFVMGVQADVAANGIDMVEVYLGEEVAPGFFAWLVPTSPGRALIGLLSRKNPADYLRELMLSLVSQGRIATADVEFSYGGIPLKTPARTYTDRAIVVGAAAGQVKPTTGGGVYYGLLCADIAAENLHRALENDTLSAKSLAGYEREWRRKLGRELRVGYWARKFYERLSDSQIDRIFDIVQSNGIDKALAEANDLSFDWHGRVVLKLIGFRALSQVFGAVSFPFTRKQVE